KGIEEFLKSAQTIKMKYPNTRFHICGAMEEDYSETIEDYQNRNIIKYHGIIENIRDIYIKMHCTIHPSYHEGMSNVLLESAATGRPVLASDIPGCKETFDEGISGIGFKPRDTQGLIHAIEKFMQLPYEEKRNMGLAGRVKVEKEFEDRKSVV